MSMRRLSGGFEDFTFLVDESTKIVRQIRAAFEGCSMCSLMKIDPKQAGPGRLPFKTSNLRIIRNEVIFATPIYRLIKHFR